MLSKRLSALIRAKFLLICWGLVAHTWAGGLGIFRRWIVMESVPTEGRDGEKSGFLGGTETLIMYGTVRVSEEEIDEQKEANEE